MSSRRKFVRQLLGATAGLAASRALASGHVLGANDRVRVALIGAGGRGQEILRSALRSANTEAVAVADVYALRLEEVKGYVPGIKTFTDFRRLLEIPGLDAVLIATPQHQHALNFVPSIQAGKDVYQEKTMAFNPDHAKRMRSAYIASNRVVQIGIQSISSAAWYRARELARPELLGDVTAVHAHMYRNAPYGGWLKPVPRDCTPERVDWKLFQGEAEPRPFDADRVIHWRFYWDYSGGNVFENMVHQVGFWYKALNLQIPRSVTMNGGNYRSPKMQVPDTMDIAMDQPENLLFTWNSGFYSRHYNADEQVLGTKGTIIRRDDDVSYAPEGGTGNPKLAEPAKGTDAPPDVVGAGDDTDLHMRNFIDCVRSRKEPNCPFEVGFRSAIAVRMAITSYREGQKVRWDAQREEVV
jgi:predicted dehydrogenase